MAGGIDQGEDSYEQADESHLVAFNRLLKSLEPLHLNLRDRQDSPSLPRSAIPSQTVYSGITNFQQAISQNLWAGQWAFEQ